MNKTELIRLVATAAGVSQTEARKALKTFANVVSEALQKGEKVSVTGFGTFSVTQKSARVGINPLTKERMEIPARKAVKFRAGADLEKAIG